MAKTRTIQATKYIIVVFMLNIIYIIKHNISNTLYIICNECVRLIIYFIINIV